MPLLNLKVTGAVPLYLVFQVALKRAIPGWLSSKKLVAPKRDNIQSNYISHSGHRKSPENLDFPGFLKHFDTV